MVGERGNENRGADSAGAVHTFLIRIRGLVEGFCGEEACCYNDDIEVLDGVFRQGLQDMSPCICRFEIDARDVGYV